MEALTPDLYSRCRSLFTNCDKFESDKILRAFFKLNLFPLHIGLPEADNIEARVELCLAHMIDRTLTGGEPALSVLLEKLRDQYPEGHPHKSELQALYDDVAALLRPVRRELQTNLHTRHQLFDLLLRLNFRWQLRIVSKVLEEQYIASFLIHGLPDHGQSVLIYRLSHLLPRWSTIQPIAIDAGANGTGNSSRSIWREIALRVNLPRPDSDLHTLANTVCQWLQTRDVIFIIKTVDYIPIPILKDWLEEFWKPLVTAVQNYPFTKQPYYLLLFMVDYSGRTSNSKLIFIDDPEQIGGTYLPLRLPENGKFPEDELDIWLDSAIDVLPSRIPIQKLLEMTENGVPDLVYEKICAHCGMSWEGGLTP